MLLSSVPISINEALRIDPSNRSSKSIKASILTEDGISSSNRANLLAAKELFKEILRESDHWFDYYNYGNVLSALDEPEEALTQYLKAVRLDNHQPELWKNMGSVYNTLGQHDEELRCFDKALELDENLAEAYISKGVTFLQIFNKAILGIQLIEQGLNLNPEIGMRWPHVWYWLALGYLRRNKKIEALNKVEAGLTYASSHQGLLELKASILSELWRKDRKYASLACRYFQFLLEYTSGASQIVHELIELSLVMNKEEQGWMYIEQFYHNQKVSEILKGYGYSLSTAKNAVKYYHIYRSFRDIKPIEQYDTEFGSNVIFKQPSVISSMDLLFNVIFGMGCTVLERRKIEAHHIKKMVVHIGRELAEKIPYLCRSVEIESEDQNFKIELLTQVCVDFPLLGLLESSRQTGYIGGYYGIPNAELDHYIIDDEITTLQTNIVSQSFLEMNRRLHLFLEETEA